MCYTESNSGTWHFCGIFPAMEQKVEGWVIMKKILFVASEAVPFIKTGGLADVVGSLPKCFDKEYFDVRVMIPKYLCIKDKFLSNLTYVNHFYMDYLGQSRYVGILEYVYEGITFYLSIMRVISGAISHMVIGITTWKNSHFSHRQRYPHFL